MHWGVLFAPPMSSKPLATAGLLEVAMRRLVSCTGLFLLFVVPGIVSAEPRLTIHQPRAGVSYDVSPKPDSRRMTLHQELILRRAKIRAAHRRARIEARKWAGESAQRPNIRCDLPIIEWYIDESRIISGRSVWVGTQRRKARAARSNAVQ